jgi:hypothetical protein
MGINFWNSAWKVGAVNSKKVANLHKIGRGSSKLAGADSVGLGRVHLCASGDFSVGNSELGLSLRYMRLQFLPCSRGKFHANMQ